MPPLARQLLPPGIHTAADYAAQATRVLDPSCLAYFEATAGDGATARANRAAWDALALRPRVLRAVAGLHTRCELFGRAWPTPLLVAPMALHRLAHADGELATAVAAAAQGAGLVFSCQASQRLEDVAPAMLRDAGRGPLWFQLYPLPSRDDTLQLVRRAEAAGCEALVVTVDAAVRVARRAERAPGFALPAGITTVNLPATAQPADLAGMLARAPTWDDIAWLRRETRLPLLLKGVLHPLDAQDAVAHGVDGLIVSNHGGRTLDGAAATALALPAVVQAAGTLPVLVDGGLQHGTDVLRALALGARAVLIGRPVLWGLATAGAAGVAHVLRLLRDELEAGMAQCGARDLQALGPGLLLPTTPRG